MSWGGDGSPQFISTTDLQLQSLLVDILYLQRLACLYRGHYHIQLCALEERLYINIVKKKVSNSTQIIQFGAIQKNVSH